MTRCNHNRICTQDRPGNTTDHRTRSSHTGLTNRDSDRPTAKRGRRHLCQGSPTATAHRASQPAQNKTLSNGRSWTVENATTPGDGDWQERLAGCPRQRGVGTRTTTAKYALSNRIPTPSAGAGTGNKPLLNTHSLLYPHCSCPRTHTPAYGLCVGTGCRYMPGGALARVPPNVAKRVRLCDCLTGQQSVRLGSMVCAPIVDCATVSAHTFPWSAPIGSTVDRGSGGFGRLSGVGRRGGWWGGWAGWGVGERLEGGLGILPMTVGGLTVAERGSDQGECDSMLGVTEVTLTCWAVVRQCLGAGPNSPGAAPQAIVRAPGE